MERYRRIAAVVQKEFRQIVRDIGTLGTLVILPLFLLALFGYAISLDVKEIKVAVWDQDRGSVSREYLRGFFNSSYFSRRQEIRDSAQGDLLLAEGKVLAVLIIPPDFGRDVERGQTVPVQFLVDGSNSNTATTAIGYIEGADREFSLRRAKAALERNGASAGTASSGAAGGGVDLRARVVYNQELKSVNTLIPGLIVLILTLAAVVSTALALVREKEHGTWEQLSVSPVAPAELVFGKTLPYLLIALLSTTLILVASRLLFAVPLRGSLVLLYLMTILFLFSSLGIGILISSIVATQQAAFMISAILTVLPTFVLTGFVFPIRNMPAFVRAITYVFPARYYLTILRAIMLKGAGLQAFYREALILFGFSILTLALGTARVSRTRS